MISPVPPPLSLYPLPLFERVLGEGDSGALLGLITSRYMQKDNTHIHTLRECIFQSPSFKCGHLVVSLRPRTAAVNRSQRIVSDRVSSRRATAAGQTRTAVGRRTTGGDLGERGFPESRRWLRFRMAVLDRAGGTAAAADPRHFHAQEPADHEYRSAYDGAVNDADRDPARGIIAGMSAHGLWLYDLIEFAGSCSGFVRNNFLGCPNQLVKRTVYLSRSSN